MTSQDTVKALREALKISPDNVPLRQHLAQILMSLGHLEDAEQEYRQALLLEPQEIQLKLGLAQAFFQQGKHSQSSVIIEELVKRSKTPAEAYLLHARLLLNSGAVRQAVNQYCCAVEIDASVADNDFAERLGINKDEDKAEIVDGKVRAYADETNNLSDILDNKLESSGISFADVGGMNLVKEEIRLKIIYPLTQSELYKAYGKTIGGGILLYGPPGCGKTYLARATAGEINSSFIAVGINDVLDMWLGNSERNLHDIFEQARYNQPCVLFFDEVDALAANRTDLRQSSSRMVINQFLSELDGAKSSNEGVLTLAATNAPWHLDGAFRRPGRFDRIIFIPPPDAEARAAILRLLCRGKPVDVIDFDYISKKTENYSGADLKALMDLAIEHKLQEAIKVGVPKPLTTKDLVTLTSVVKPSTKEWFATARNYALYANESGLYDDILKYLKMR
ncbi:MAG: AAA family ATPase [Cyanobacteria bacterium P01_A01_bin.84]